MSTKPAMTSTGNETIEELKVKINDLTKEAQDMCVRAEEQAKDMETYVKNSAHFEELMTALDKSVKEMTVVTFSTTAQSLINQQPLHQKLMHDMHMELVKLQENQHEISLESTKIASELVNLNHRNQKAHTAISEELEKKVGKHERDSKLMADTNASKHAKNVVVSNEFLQQVMDFVQHVDNMIKCKIEKERVFELMCKEIVTIQNGAVAFGAHLKAPDAHAQTPEHLLLPPPSRTKPVGKNLVLGLDSLPPSGHV